MTKRPFGRLVLPLALLAQAGLANADIDKRQSCVFKHIEPRSFPVATVAGTTPALTCYVGFKCEIGLRGDWLDLTDDLDGAGESKLKIEKKGVERNPFGTCIPDGTKDRHGWILLSGTPRDDGEFRIKLNRPGAMGMGRDSDSVTVKVKRAERFIAEISPPVQAARVGEPLRLSYVGDGLRDLSFPPNDGYSVRVLERFDDALRVEVTFRRVDDFSLLGITNFANETVHRELDRLKPSKFIVRVSLPRPDNNTNGDRSPEASEDLVPHTNRASGQGLLREVRGAPLPRTVDPQFCSRANAQGVASVEPLVWGVQHAAGSGTTISRAFDVALFNTNGSANKTAWTRLEGFTVTSLNGGTPATRSNYPGRPAQVTVQQVQRNGQALCQAAAGTRFDPPQLAISVDSGGVPGRGVLNEPNETNNDQAF